MIKQRSSLLRPDSMEEKNKKMSYGVFLFAPETETFLVMQNRDSQAFMFFFMIRDIETWSVDKLYRLLEECTHDEVQRLLYFSFHEVYYDMYLKHDPVKYQRQERLAFTNYRYFHSREDLKAMARRVRGTSIPWEFPKGRPEPGEQPLESALRELEEETGIRVDINKITSAKSFSNAVMTFLKPKPFLRHHVTVQLFGIAVHFKNAEDRDRSIRYRDFHGSIRSRSLSDECLHARWVRMEEARELLPPYLFETLVRWRTEDTRPLVDYTFNELDRIVMA